MSSTGYGAPNTVGTRYTLLIIIIIIILLLLLSKSVEQIHKTAAAQKHLE